MQKSTYCALIDYKKVHDSVNREILWMKLEQLGFRDQLLNVIQSLYTVDSRYLEFQRTL